MKPFLGSMTNESLWILGLDWRKRVSVQLTRLCPASFSYYYYLNVQISYHVGKKWCGRNDLISLRPRKTTPSAPICDFHHFHFSSILSQKEREREREWNVKWNEESFLAHFYEHPCRLITKPHKLSQPTYATMPEGPHVPIMFLHDTLQEK